MNVRYGPSKRASSQRGIAMLTATLAIVALFLVVIAILRYTSYSANNAGSTQSKQLAVDAAEAGLNDGIRALDVAGGNIASGTSVSHTMANGASYTWTMTVNNSGGTATPPPDGISVPSGDYYITSVGSMPSERAQTVGAIVAKATGISGMNTAINAAQNIFDQKVQVLESSSNVPADVHANGTITTGGNQGQVQGSTYAGGATNTWTNANHHYVNQPLESFPTAGMVNALAQTALGVAQSGTTIQGSNPTGTYTGNVYVNGSVNLASGTITFNGGGTVYVNGNVVLSGNGQIVNNNNSFIVVNGTFSDSGNGQMVVNAAGGEMMVLGADPTPSLCASSGTGCAVTLTGNGQSVGLIFTPNGSIDMAGNGTVTGALMSGVNVYLGGGGSSAVKFDSLSSSQHLTATNYKVISYIEK